MDESLPWPVRVEDLRGCSYEQFVAYAFDRPLPAKAGGANWWNDPDTDEDVELLVDPPLQLQHATRLFTDPVFLAERFDPARLDQGFWFLAMGHASDYGAFFVESLWDLQVAVESRCQCVAAMFDLYAKLFARHPVETATNMWWDLIATFVLENVHGDDLIPHPVAEHERVRREMVATLTRILALDPRHCKEAALHGLHHVGTAEERAAVITPWIDRLDEELRAYARLCVLGRAQ